MDANAKQQIVEKLKAANNVLVTVSSSPNVDQLSAAIGLTIMLNKLGKHATAVYSGATPSTIQFLQPDATLQKNTDSLQDFIISLDKSKADKLRYKVEDDVVKIFITPYRTSISSNDLNFSQGDFNVDAVVALGVDQREHLDQAITSHGRILHDATVMTVMAGSVASNIGSINWQEPAASSLSEMLVSISEAFQSGLLDAQMSTAFLTGIVAETERFKNNKTSPKVMTMSAQLMAAGANQQLIADSLMQPEPITEEPEKVEHNEEEPKSPAVDEPAEKPVEPEAPPESILPPAEVETTAPDAQAEEPPKAPSDELDVKSDSASSDALSFSLHDLENTDVKYGPEGPDDAEDEKSADRILIDDNGMLMSEKDASLVKKVDESTKKDTSKDEPVAPEDPEHEEEVKESGPTGGDSYVSNKPKKVIQPLSSQNNGSEGAQKSSEAIEGPPEKTLSDIESAVGRSAGDSPETAREEVEKALASDIPNQPPGPIAALNAQPMGEDSGETSLAPPPLPPPPTMPGSNDSGSGLSLPPVS